MMTFTQYQVYQITNAFSGKIWKNVSVVDRYLLGDWRADEKRYFETGDIVVLYNETFPMQIAGRVVCGGVLPLTRGTD